MKITLYQFGGLAAGMRRPPLVLESAKLAPDEATHLARLVDAARTTTASGAAPGPDQMSYRLAIDAASGAMEVAAHDGAMTPSFEALMRFVRDKAQG